MLAVPDLGRPIGIRDRAILEMLYSKGMRRMELIRLHLADVDAERGTVMIRQGRGRKDRMIPIGARARLDRAVSRRRAPLTSPAASMTARGSSPR